MKCSKCNSEKPITDFYNCVKFKCLECKKENKTTKPRKPAIKNSDIYEYLKDKYNIQESLKDIQSKIKGISDEILSDD